MNPGNVASEIACPLIFFCGMMFFFAIPTAVELSHQVGVLSCGQPISMRVWRRVTISLAQMKRPSSSASAAKDMKNMMIFAILRTGPFILLTGKFSDKIMCAPARL